MAYIVLAMQSLNINFDPPAKRVRTDNDYKFRPNEPREHHEHPEAHAEPNAAPERHAGYQNQYIHWFFDYNNQRWWQRSDNEEEWWTKWYRNPQQQESQYYDWYSWTQWHDAAAKASQHQG